MGGFDGIQVLALDVLDQRDFQQLRIRDILDDYDGNFGNLGELGGTPAALARDDLIGLAVPPDDQRLDDSVGANGSRQFFEPVRLKDVRGCIGLGWIARWAGCVGACGVWRRSGRCRPQAPRGGAVRQERRRPLPSALRGLSVALLILQDLLGEFDIALRAARAGVIHQDRLPVAGRFRQADAARDDSCQDLILKKSLRSSATWRVRLVRSSYIVSRIPSIFSGWENASRTLSMVP